MTMHNANNERIKRKYFTFLKEAKRNSEATVDASAKALDRFEVYTKHRDFRAFHVEQAIGFKKYFAEQKGQRSGMVLSKVTLHSTLTQLKRFFQWLSDKPNITRLYADLGDKDHAFAWLNTAYQEHDTNLINLRTDFHFDSLRSAPRYAELVRKIGLPQ